MITILTVWKKNAIYDNTWVKKIQNSISRNLTTKHKHICFTNENLDFCETIKFDNSLPDPGEGYWYKTNLYRNLPQTSGPCLYFDLDMVITGTLDPMVNSLLNYTTDDKELWGAKSPFIPNNLPDTDYFNSSIIFWRKNPTHLWDKFLSKSPKVWKMSTKTKYTHGDQAFVANNSKFGFVNDYCPQNFIERLKNYQEGKTSIIFFAGKEKPNGFLLNNAVNKHWRT
jgi:hypothetical protein